MTQKVNITDIIPRADPRFPKYVPLKLVELIKIRFMGSACKYCIGGCYCRLRRSSRSWLRRCLRPPTRSGSKRRSARVSPAGRRPRSSGGSRRSPPETNLVRPGINRKSTTSCNGRDLVIIPCLGNYIGILFKILRD